MTDEPMGIPIDAETFRSLVAEYLDRLEPQGDATLDAEDYVTMIRLWNTIELHALGDRDPLFARYAAAFFPDAVQRATELLGATPTKGMALRSKEHDVYIGGKPHPNSQYLIKG